MRFASMLRAVALVAALAAGAAHAQPMPSIDRASFYEVLSPYGSWITVQGYGTVWRPHLHVVGADFYPYATAGHWEYTDYGWTWFSDWSWGWVPFHHGRWLFTDDHGWVWVPDDEWAPAWVDWRIGDGYIGWVPLGPPGVLLVWSWYAPRWWWVHAQHFHRRDLYRQRIDNREAEDDAWHRAVPVPHPSSGAPRGPTPEQVRGQGGIVEPPSGQPVKRLIPGAIATERRIGVTSPVRPQPPATRPQDPTYRREVIPAPGWRAPQEPPFAQPWQLRPPPAQPPEQPLPPGETPEALKKKQQKPAPAVPGPIVPAPGRKLPPRLP